MADYVYISQVRYAMDERYINGLTVYKTGNVLYLINIRWILVNLVFIKHSILKHQG